MPIQIILKSIVAVGLIVLIFFPIFQKHNRIDNHIYQSCLFVSKKIVPLEKNIEEWLLNCRTQSHKAMNSTNSLQQLLAHGNRIFSELKVSHLELFNEQESQAIWNDTDFENGIESRYIDGQLIVTKVSPNSEAKKKLLQRGDRVVLGKDEGLSPYELNRWKGKLTFERSKKNFTIDLEPKTLVTLRDITLTELRGVKVITVESFKSQYFSDEKLDVIFSKIKSTDKIVVDLRGNNGGNFVSLLVI
jgi:carboxyl-terminal processing protease